MGSHFFDRFAGRFGRHGGGHGRRHGDYIDDRSQPTEARQQPTRVLVCPRCWADNKPDARFCGACGNALGQANAACAECGVPLTAGAKFCSSCGRATS
ncbi:MAG: zinc ribbon domain-containing protein [Rhizobiales bacterium]|nr:zinc ribbon domain-containing protein [Hyphomicrobiales bacterium]